MNAVSKRKIELPINDVSATGIHYTIVPKDLAGHLFFVTVHVAKPDAEGQKLSLPAWIPGSYMV